jgi:hypothetical protein
MTNASLELCKAVNDALNWYRSRSRTLRSDLLVMDGFTSPMQRVLLNNICYRLKERCNYFEVGVFKGASLLSAGYCNQGKFTGMDNMSWPGAVPIEGLIQADFSLAGSIDLIPPGVNVFFFDANGGDVTAAGHSLDRMDKVLADPFILIADNWSCREIRQNIGSAINRLRWSKAAVWYLESEDDCDMDGWWNGWAVMVIEKKPSRSVSVLDHIEIKSGVPPLHDFAERRRRGFRSIKDYANWDGVK